MAQQLRPRPRPRRARVEPNAGSASNLGRWAVGGSVLAIGLCLVGIVGLYWMGVNGDRVLNSAILDVQRQAAPSTLPGTSAPDPTGWVVISDAAAIDGAETSTLTLLADNDVRGRAPILVIRCSGGKTDVYIQTGIFIALSGEKVPTRRRFDDGPVESPSMFTSSDGDALFFQSGVRFVSEALDREAMIVEFTPYSSKTEEAIFRLSGLRDAITPMSDECGISF